MRKGTSIEDFLTAVPDLYLGIYKNLPTLPTSYRKKKVQKKIPHFFSPHAKSDVIFQYWCSILENKNNFFLRFTNEMLLKKKEVNKNFFFNEKLLIFVPLRKNFFNHR